MALLSLDQATQAAESGQVRMTRHQRRRIREEGQQKTSSGISSREGECEIIVEALRKNLYQVARYQSLEFQCSSVYPTIVNRTTVLFTTLVFSTR